MRKHWRLLVGMGSAFYQGLDLPALEIVERRLPPAPGTIIPGPRELWWQLETLEDEALLHLNPH